MPHSAYVFDAYGTLFGVHAAVRKHAEAVGRPRCNAALDAVAGQTARNIRGCAR